MDGRYLIISDLQIPFEHSKALEFCLYLKRHYKIDLNNVYNCGDETDNLFGGLYRKDINGEHSAMSEISESIEKLQAWYRAFPSMKLAISNHGTRWMRKAFEAEIPSIMIKDYSEIIKAPKAWTWKKYWRINSKHPFILEHLDDYSGPTPHVSAAISNACSTVGGHHHSKAGVEHLVTNGYKIWGMVAGCLIDFDKYAFNYCRNAQKKPNIGASIVLDEGALPIWIRMD